MSAIRAARMKHQSDASADRMRMKRHRDHHGDVTVTPPEQNRENGTGLAGIEVTDEQALGAWDEYVQRPARLAQVRLYPAAPRRIVRSLKNVPTNC